MGGAGARPARAPAAAPTSDLAGGAGGWPPPARDCRPVGVERRALGVRVAVRDRAGASLVRRPLRPFHASARAAAERRLRPHAERAWTCGGLAVRARRRVAVCGRAGGTRPRARRFARHRLTGGRAAAGPARARRRRAARAPSARARPLPRALRAAAAQVPVRPGRLQGRLGARRADPVERLRSAAGRARSISAARSTRSRTPSGRPGAAARPSGPFVLLVQQTVFDDTRAPAGKHSAWAYCHVPNGSSEDLTERIEAQVERFAPGFGELVLARNTIGPAGVRGPQPQHRRRRLQRRRDGPRPAGRPARAGSGAVPRRRSTSVYLCSASTPPGGGVHGMCGYWAALAAVKSRRAARY